MEFSSVPHTLSVEYQIGCNSRVSKRTNIKFYWAGRCSLQSGIKGGYSSRGAGEKSRDK